MLDNEEGKIAMKKAQKKILLEFIKTLYEAQAQIKDMINKKSITEASDLLGQCQEGAIQMGSLIEQLEGEGYATIGLLEEYCEMVYLIYQDIDSNRIKNGNKVYKRLNSQLILIENSVKKDIKQKLEAVFLPYNVSMWDSLESVWKAAYESDYCDTYVIPIPYYSRNPDGSFKEEHWEGEQYPDYVPITRYQDYSFEERNPDIIFIHNPYDDLNMVTSVHPFFYSTNLKKHTDNLIYIPYFILDEISPDDQLAVESIQHFCTLPGVLNADKVIVQSEQIRQIYVNVLTKSAGKDTRKHWENKILGIGSPKLDKVLNSDKENLQIPEDWIRIIHKPDGNRKKIVFYNNSIGALLQHDGEMLRKMKDVFEVFKDNSDSIAMLWRPHPLIRATIESMRPQLWREYKELVDNYREEGWGIYDNTPDVERAIALSDAYYGDKSSLVAMYKTTHKNMLIQNVNINKVNKYSYGGISTAVLLDGYIWGTANEFNALFKIDLETDNIELIERFPEEKDFKKTLFGDMVHIDGKLIFAPMAANNIVAYDISSRKFTLIPVDERVTANCKLYKNDYKFCKAVVQDRYIFFVGCSFPAIIKMDVDTYHITYITEWTNVLDGYISDWSDTYFRSVYISKEQDMWLPSCSCNVLMRFSPLEGSFQYYTIGKRENHYCDIEYDGKLFWLSSKNGQELISWDPSKSSIIHTVESVKGIISSKMFIKGTALYIVPWEDSEVKKIETVTGQLVGSISIEDTHSGFAELIIQDNRIILFTFDGEVVETNDLQEGKWIKHNIKYSDENIRKGLCRKSMKLGLNESRITRLYDFLQILMEETVSLNKKHEINYIGYTVFDEVSRG